MFFDFTDSQKAFRTEVRAFLAEHFPARLARRYQEGEERLGDTPWDSDIRAFFTALNARGWLALDLGTDQPRLSHVERLILFAELDAANAPRDMRVTAISVIPAIVALGTETNKAQWLDPLLAGDVTLSIGYSEPSAGSDMAAMRTTAVREENGWRINGQKAWNTRGHLSTHIWMLARTGPPDSRHKGLSIFIVPLDAPGVTIQNVPTWGDHMLNDVFFDDVHVPFENLIGPENAGWQMAMAGLEGERAFLGLPQSLAHIYEKLKAHFGRDEDEAPSKSDHPEFGMAMARFEVDLDLASLMAMDIASRRDLGVPWEPQALALKIFTSEMRTRLADFAMQALGLEGLLDELDPAAPLDGDIELLLRRSPLARIGAGANEVLRDVIAQRSLGMPRR